ncbi:branched-chain amino acid--2-keto-4-methylthiobutyrate aminotransferase [Thalassobius vesicularis]|uniref:Probable branched-chain-amino-acid aminotransferase n=1 Tax=Thalassobius vesicularis TaxID=1294297 RepID=A0A4V3UZ85_9RHOB|nr:aminotransferase class IV [Thalassobius vesicularis]THD75749.1 branched-chain amino acid--2-keto-4-methylthiobutyrate aminotransferase [Thalassobius vesicularis]
MTDFSAGAAWVKGRVVPIGEASIGVLDWGLTHSDATYDVVPVWRGGFFRLDDYLDRFMASMAAVRLDVGLDRGQIRAALIEMVAASGLRDAYVAMVALRGSPLIPGTRDPRYCANHFIGWCVPYVNIIPPARIAEGVRVYIPDDIHRIPEDCVNPRAKNYHWGDFTQGLFAAKDRDCDTTLLTDHAGNVTEGPGFNVFAIFGNRVVTPDRGVLEGLTRRTVLEICADKGYQIEVRALPLHELLEADEVFLSTSSGGVVPVAQVNDTRYGNAAPGPKGMAIRESYFDWMLRPDLRLEVVYAN